MENVVLVVGKDYRYLEDGIPRAVVTLKAIEGKKEGGGYSALRLTVVRNLEHDLPLYSVGSEFAVDPSTAKAPDTMPAGWELKSP